MQLPLLDGAAQIALELQAAVLLSAHADVEDLDLVGPCALGPVHGDLGLAQQLGGVLVGAVVESDADGGGENDLLAGDVDGGAQRAAHLLGQHGQLARVGLAEQEQRELVAADPAQRVLRAQVAPQAAGDGQEQAVADDEAEGRVHGLELVDVDEQQRRPHQRLERGALGGGRQAVEEELAVGQTREAVVHGIVHQPLLCALGVRHLANQADAAQVAPVRGRHAGGLELEPAVGVVDVAHAELDAHLAARALLHRGKQQLEALAVGGVHVLGEVVDLGGKLARLVGRVEIGFYRELWRRQRFRIKVGQRFRHGLSARVSR